MAHAHMLDAAPVSNRFALEVSAGLSQSGQKTLPCKYLYDAVGSILFEAICALPEYGLTAADARLLHAHAEAMIAPFPSGLLVAELGSGSAQKTRWLLQALARRQDTHYLPIEISELALERCQAELAGIRGLDIRPLQLEYLEGLAALARQRAQGPWRGRPLLLLFLGSTLGNFDPGAALAFLRSLRGLLVPGDGLLLGLDLVKPVPRLRLAYDDPAGVTAAFNLNLLARLNRELGADFDLRQWQHQVRYSPGLRRVEMHLRSRREQSVHIPAAGLAVRFRRGETIWTESSHKFDPAAVAPLLASAGFALHRQWLDPAWPFAENLGLVTGAA